MSVDPQQIRALARDYTAAWNSGSADAVASFYAADGRIVINAGTPYLGSQGVSEMAAGFFADVPDLTLTCDDVRAAGRHVAYFWTFTGTHAATGKPLRVVGWEEWDLDDALKIARSRGWFDPDDYARQTSSG